MPINPLAVLASQPSALVPLATLPEVWGVDIGTATERLAELQGAGLVEVWPDAPGGPAAILTGSAARELGLELATPTVHVDRPSAFCWRPIGRATPERAKGVIFSDVTAAPSGVDPLDQRPGPCELAEIRETLERFYLAAPPRKRSAFPWLSWMGQVVLVGANQPWPPPALGLGETCQACGGATLPEWVVCLACIDREAHAVAQERHTGGRKRPRLAGGRGKAQAGKLKAARGKRRRSA